MKHSCRDCELGNECPDARPHHICRHWQIVRDPDYRLVVVAVALFWVAAVILAYFAFRK